MSRKLREGQAKEFLRQLMRAVPFYLQGYDFKRAGESSYTTELGYPTHTGKITVTDSGGEETGAIRVTVEVLDQEGDPVLTLNPVFYINPKLPRATAEFIAATFVRETLAVFRNRRLNYVTSGCKNAMENAQLAQQQAWIDAGGPEPPDDEP